MRDWEAEVRKNLNLDLPLQQREEVIAELASHLEDDYEQLLAEGLSEAEAFDRCIEAAGWRELVRNIRRAKEDVMNHRVKTLWLPGLAAFAPASLALMFLQFFGSFRPIVWFKGDAAIVLYVPWLVVLPLCGAVGAYFSLSGGGKRLARLVAGVFPVIVMFAAFCLLLIVGIIVERNAFIIHHPIYFRMALFNWVVLPGFLLALGAAPLCVRQQHGPAVAS